MTRFLLDTDTFSHFLRGHPAVVAAVGRADGVAVSIVTVEEVWDGWQAVVRKAKSPAEVGRAYDRLTATVAELARWAVVSFPAAAVERYAGLRKLRLNVGVNDLRIAAIALDLGATVATSNTRDFGRVPGLALVDWTIRGDANGAG